MDRFEGAHNNHAGARTTAVVPTDHYSEIVVGHVGNEFSYVGASVRIQQSGAAIDSNYLWWGSLANGANNFLYRIVADGTSYSAASIVPHSPFADGDRIRLIARGPVIYGIKNGAREFIYNTGTDAIQYSTGTAGILAYVPNSTVTNAVIASWSTGAAPVSSGAWASSTFAGVEDPLDEGDRWYPLPGYSGFRKAGGFASGKDAGHNLSGAWGIAPPQKQYSEVTLGFVGTGGGGPMVRIDRNSPDQSGWLLLLWPDNPSFSGIYKIGKVNPNDGGFTPVRTFTPAAIVTGDKWRLTADGNTLEVSKNGVSQFTYTTDGSYPTGDVGIETLTPAFTLMGWEGGTTAGAPPTITSFAPASGPVGTTVTITGTNLTGATSVTFNGASATFTVASATSIQATVPAGATTGPVGVTTPAGAATSTASFIVVNPPVITSFAPTSGPVGTSVTISGSDFSGATEVRFNSVSASFTLTSDTAIQATVPPGAATGPLSVTTSAGTTTSTSNFTVKAALTALKAGTGTGTVTSTSNPASPDQIDCGATCSVSFDSGTVVTLTATPAAGSTHIGWIGCDTVSGASCTVTMSAARSVTAAFSLQTFSLSVGKTRLLTGNGTVTSTSDPASANQINCGGTCSASYDSGTVVTLNVKTDLLSVFSGWDGCDAVSGTTCTVNMNAAKSVTAHFAP
jgi:hypothetical protein